MLHNTLHELNSCAHGALKQQTFSKCTSNRWLGRNFPIESRGFTGFLGRGNAGRNYVAPELRT
jgi:hypothetical protein